MIRELIKQFKIRKITLNGFHFVYQSRDEKRVPKQVYYRISLFGIRIDSSLTKSQANKRVKQYAERWWKEAS